jgi:UDP-N-acetylglucosamine 2-epimerase (non-hydrolysing)
VRACIVLGTRPEIVKMSPIIRSCQDDSFDFYVIHTGQHYSYDMDRVFFEDLDLPGPEYHLDVGSASHAVQTGRIMEGVERTLLRDPPSFVLVQGDTNTVLGATLAAAKLNVPVGHVEAGLRSYDRTMPEEKNRIVADHLSTYLFAPTEGARRNLNQEGIVEGVHVTGNTIVDAVEQNMVLARVRSTILEDIGLDRGRYIIATAHREENVDDPRRLANILAGLHMVMDETGLPVVYPMHPRTVRRVEELGMDTGDILVIPPIGYLDFLHCLANAKAVLTDSGGVQEEACILGVPCITMRENTERPETVDVGANCLVGTDPEAMTRAIQRSKARDWQNPFGDGHTAERILCILCPLGADDAYAKASMRDTGW